jgi:mono/diheme cytochrome c family protein
MERGIENLKTRNKALRYISFLIILLLVSLDGFAHEEQHEHEHHRHLEYAKIKNPVAKTEMSIAQGRKLYEKNCIACHGEAGKGGTGPGLSVPVLIHGSTDGEMFHVITDGVAGTAMKGFKKELPDELRWHLVNYIKSQKYSDKTK